MKTPRPLTQDDLNIWHRVARTVHPLSQSMHHAEALKRQSYIHLPPAPKPILHKSPTDLQTRSDKKVRKGKVAIETKIDLHDLTRDQAFPALVNKLTRAHHKGRRCVLVVTGKGANLEGVLRKSLPGWLMDARLRPFVASFAPAHIRHGGTGAFYVFLKRKKG